MERHFRIQFARGIVLQRNINKVSKKNVTKEKGKKGLVSGPKNKYNRVRMIQQITRSSKRSTSIYQG